MTGALNRDRRLRSWARSLVAANDALSPLELASAVASMVRLAVGAPRIEGAHRLASTDDGVSVHVGPPDGWADPWLPGIVHEQAVSPERRTARGAWYTPKSVVEGLVRLAMPDNQPLPDFVADPTCGGGAFLLAVLDHLVGAGRTPVESLNSIAGQDIDPDAAAVSRLAIDAWAAANGIDLSSVNGGPVTRSPQELVTVGDALDGYPEWWPTEALIIGNPPFGSPLRAGATPKTVAQFREGRAHLLGPYADLAAVHLLAAIERSAPGSVVALVQPQSILSGRDTAGLRDHCAESAPLRALWTAREAVFDAGVRACAVVVAPGVMPPASVLLAAGPDVTEVDAAVSSGSQPVSWSGLAAASLGGPQLPSPLVNRTAESARLGELITATAGFRDEYYGLVAACEEWEGAPGEEQNQLITVGAVEPLASLWGVDASKFGRRRWLRPTIDLDALDSKVRTWTERQMVPKIVLATQSRVLEPVVDRRGTLIPATPLLSIQARDESLDLVAAVLLAPPVVAWAWQQWFGAAMAVDALKLAARQVAELPLPSDRGAWEEAAAIVAAAPEVDTGGPGQDDASEAWNRACEVAEVMNRAYGAGEAVYLWWLDRSRRPMPTGGASRHAAHHAG